MAQLSEEKLARIYPSAKTYDQLQAERNLLEERRRPKFVALKIALWTSLSVPIVALVYYGAQRVGLTALRTAGPGSNGSMTVLAGVCLVVLFCIMGLVMLYYLRSLIDGLASKALTNTTPLYLVLLGIVCIAGGIGIMLHVYKYSLVAVTLVPMLWVWTTSLVATQVIKMRDDKV